MEEIVIAQPLYLLLATFGIAWWAFVIAVSVFTIVCLEHRKFSGAFALLLFALVMLLAFSDMPIIHYIKNNPINVVLIAVAYFGIGVVYGLLKWGSFCAEALEKFKEFKRKFISSNELNISADTPIPEKYISDFRTKVRWEGLDVPPMPWNHKEELIGWMVYWPWCLVWSIFSDLFYRIFRTIYRMLADVYVSISKWMFRSVAKDLEAMQNLK